MIKHGIFCKYLGKEYMVAKRFNTIKQIIEEKERIKRLKPSFYERCYKDLAIEPGDIELWSTDKKDLERSFYVIQNDVYGFICMKVVHRSEVKAAYRYNTYAYYSGIKCDIRNHKNMGFFFLETYNAIKIDENSGMLIEFKNRGFTLGREIDPGHFSFIMEVKQNDPNLQIFEERKEIDVNSL